ncbi:MAG: 16S rRNA (uracil(1498)-N(3))-methyltransferase [Gammaproteobacteria bacterium]|nr:16S rRNA (uracil(1498)-N(3))-methyltransferase [Gammaproteobacteria bacterium]MBK80683.1 16S rRNA (uracil(1498)-N(3))-methyltransferase [Gammaproteobacteria bacterium]
MKHRLYHPPPLEPGQSLILGRERAHYLTRVLRLRRGETLVCFDGAGRAVEATLEDAGPRSATLRIQAVVEEAPEPSPRLHLVQALLKGASMDLVMQKATELGASDIHPVIAARSNVPLDPERLARKTEHWQRVIESAAEQCGALHLPRLHAVRTLEAWLADPPAAAILLHPGAPVLPTDLAPEDLALLVGPEGGWTDEERAAAAAAGATAHGLGQRILRGETAPLAALAALRHGWGWR